MHRTRNLIIACAAAALAISALGAPVAAAGSGKMTVVQGRPGKVDVCVNNKEVKSGVIYGSAFNRKFGTGPKRITVFKKNYRKCGGVKVASRLVKFPNGSDLTIVVTKFNPKIMVFDNKKPIDMTKTDPGTASDGWIVTRHASDIGPASFKYAINPSLTPWSPSVDPQFVKGQGVKQGHGIAGSPLLVVATRPDLTVPVASSGLYTLKPLIRYEHILVGTHTSNTRFVTIKRPVTLLVP